MWNFSWVAVMTWKKMTGVPQRIRGKHLKKEKQVTKNTGSEAAPKKKLHYEKFWSEF